MPYEPVGVERTYDDNDDSELSPMIRLWVALPDGSYFRLLAKRLQMNSYIFRSWARFILIFFLFCDYIFPYKRMKTISLKLILRIAF